MLRRPITIVLLAALCSFFAPFSRTQALTSENFFSSEDYVGIVQFSGATQNYEFRAAVGKPGTGKKAVSENFLIDRDAGWEAVGPADEEPVWSGDTAGMVVLMPERPEEDQTENPADEPLLPLLPAPVPMGQPGGGSAAQYVPGGALPVAVAVKEKEDAEKIEPGPAVNPEPLTGPLADYSPEGPQFADHGKAVTFTAAGALFLSLFLNQSLSISHLIFSVRNARDFWLIALKLWYAISSLFGLRRKPKYWGTVYDSKTKQPLDPVIVELIDAAGGMVVQQAITDMAGRYGFMAKPGKYMIRASKTNFRFPSQHVLGERDEMFDHLYHGEIMEVKDETGLVMPNIPMDQLAFDWNQEEKKRVVLFHPKSEYFLNAASAALLWSGLAALTLVVISEPAGRNYLFFTAYLLAIILRYCLPDSRMWGRVYDDKTHVLLAGIMLELSPENVPMVVYRAKSSDEGKFFLKCLPGKYNLSISRANDAGEAKVIKVIPVTVGKIGILCQDVAL
jgi:hypothetical protein